MQIIDQLDFPEYKFSLTFMASFPDGTVLPAPGSKEAHELLWSFPRTVLELTHNHGTEADPSFKYYSGNEEPYRGVSGFVGLHVDN